MSHPPPVEADEHRRKGQKSGGRGKMQSKMEMGGEDNGLMGRGTRLIGSETKVQVVGCRD